LRNGGTGGSMKIIGYLLIGFAGVKLIGMLIVAIMNTHGLDWHVRQAGWVALFTAAGFALARLKRA
jgi:hypothetical protein